MGDTATSVSYGLVKGKIFVFLCIICIYIPEHRVKRERCRAVETYGLLDKVANVFHEKGRW